MADYGTALSCVTDVDAGARIVSGNRVVAEAIARRLYTPRGRLIGYPNYGYDLTQYVNADLSPREIAAVRAEVAAECAKDPRVDRADVDIVFADESLTVTIVAHATEGPFTLVLAVSSLTVTLLSVSP